MAAGRDGAPLSGAPVATPAVAHNAWVAQLDYDLHKLGWRAFQDLCAVVLQRVLGQTFHGFADSNDAGRDGAFHGSWAPPGTSPAGLLRGLADPSTATVAQCKFSSSGSGTLTPSMLWNEVEKARLLHEHGLCDAYLLLTNLRISGNTEAWLTDELQKAGIAKVLTLDGAWICQTISQNADLRRYVPRVYGLGDLGLILDDRRMRQAAALMARLQDDLGTFVPTAAYRRAADALSGHGFVLLLGEAACGKSTIAATLALAALDDWGLGVRRVDSAAELVAAWDPDDPSQLFWVDDAFGAIRHDPALTDGWSRRLDQVMTAVEQGARVILTSRDYIYRDARHHLKDYAYPRLREQQVVVDVTELSPEERRQILYGHLKAGDQPKAVLTRWRPHLRQAVEVERFQPEVARRLAHQAFTRADGLWSADQLAAYFARPVAFLADVVRRLDPATRAAMACVYLSGNELPAPVAFTPALADAVRRLGATEPAVLAAFASANGTFLQLSQDAGGDAVWRFRHPTIREGFAAVVAEDPNAVAVFLDGLEPDELVQQVDCGQGNAPGTLVRVPTSLYVKVITKVPVPLPRAGTVWLHPAAWFLTHRCSPAFLRGWAAHHAGGLDHLSEFGMYTEAFWQPGLLAALHGAGALPEPARQAVAERLSQQACWLDIGWAAGPGAELLTDDEARAIREQVRQQILPDLLNNIDEDASGYGDDVEPAEKYQHSLEVVKAYKLVFADEADVTARLSEAEAHIVSEVQRREEEDPSGPSGSPTTAAAEGNGPGDGRRDEFDDVADGR